MNFDRLEEKIQTVFSNKLFLHISVSIASLLIIFSHRPDAFLNPQFFAEDGAVFYAEAYHYGFGSLLIPMSYFQTIPRIISLFSLLFPFALAPAVFNFSAICIRLVVVNFLLSSRLAPVVPRLSARMLLCFIYLAIPNSYEVNANLTNFHWHSGLLMFLIVIAAPPGEKIGWKFFDTIVVAIASLSGPFCILLLPITFIRWYFSREKWTFRLLCIFLVGALIQFYGMTYGERPQALSLGASFELFAKIISVQVFLSSVLGIHGYGWLSNRNLWGNLTLAFVFATGFFLLGNAVFKSLIELKLLILFGGLIFTSALIAPVSEPGQLPWIALSIPHTGIRYWFVPLLCCAVTIVYLAACAKSRIVKKLAMVLCALMPIGIFLDWKHPRFTDYEFKKYAREFEAAPPQTELVIPINPGWKMRLIKK